MLIHPAQLANLEGLPIKHIFEILWRRGDLEFLLWPQQIPIWQTLNSMPPHVVEFVVLCARQFGKSTLGVLRALAQALKHRDSCILIVGPDIKQTKDIVIPKMRFLTRTTPKGLIKQMKAENRFHVYHDLDPKASDYTEIIIAGMSDGSSSQRGKTVQEILLEEIVDVDEDTYLDEIRSTLGPALTHSKNGKIVYLTTLPKVPDHPFIIETMAKAEALGALKRYTIDDNIALTKEQYDACVERSGGKESVDFLREYLCVVVRDRTKVVVPDWSQEHNCYEVVPPDHMLAHVTIDWGGVRDKTCAVLHYYNYLEDKVIFHDERVFGPNTASTVIIEECKKMEKEFLEGAPGRKIESRFIDAPFQFVRVDLLTEAFGRYEAATPRKKEFRASVNTLNNFFKMRRAVINSEKCPFLTVTARSAMFNDAKTDFLRTESLGHADGIAAMMYAVLNQDFSDPTPNLTIIENSKLLQLGGNQGIIPSINGPAATRRFGRHR